jgi:hypothetical protein
VALEGIYSIRTRLLKAMVAKVVLLKDYDNLSWIYLKLMLIHLGLLCPLYELGHELC